MASVVAGRTASKLLSNENFDMLMLGLGGFALWEFWPLIKPFFEVGKDAFKVGTDIADKGEKAVTGALSDIGKLAGGDEKTGEDVATNVALSTIGGPVGTILSVFGVGETPKETDLQKKIDQYEQSKGKTIISNDDSARDCWKNVIEKNMTFKDALTQHIKDMNNTYPDLKYVSTINPNQMTTTTLSFSDGTKIWDAFQGVAYICKRHQSDVFERPVADGERQRFISDALNAEAIPSADYFKDYLSEWNLVAYNDVSRVYISPSWRFSPESD